MPWIRCKLRGNTVFVKANDAGEVEAGKDGRVDMLYKHSPAAKVYRANLKNLEGYEGKDASTLLADLPPGANPSAESTSESGSARSASTRGGRSPRGAAAVSSSPPPNAIIIWTDGACSGNPGPMGLGAVIIDGDDRVELSEFLGKGTNNIAELTAILRALQAVPEHHRDRPVLIHTDSSYSIGLLSKGWKAKANQALVADMRALLRHFADVRFVKVKGHAGIPENERCDELATGAISNR